MKSIKIISLLLVLTTASIGITACGSNSEDGRISSDQANNGESSGTDNPINEILDSLTGVINDLLEQLGLGALTDLTDGIVDAIGDLTGVLDALDAGDAGAAVGALADTLTGLTDTLNVDALTDLVGGLLGGGDNGEDNTSDGGDSPLGGLGDALEGLGDTLGGLLGGLVGADTGGDTNDGDDADNPLGGLGDALGGLLGGLGGGATAPEANFNKSAIVKNAQSDESTVLAAIDFLKKLRGLVALDQTMNLLNSAGIDTTPESEVGRIISDLATAICGDNSSALSNALNALSNYLALPGNQAALGLSGNPVGNASNITDVADELSDLIIALK